MNDTDFMLMALAEARAAAEAGEIPVGALVVRGSDVISLGRNANRAGNDPTLHAEMTAIRRACEALGNERLTDCELFVTKEPCAMCAGAIVHARIRRVIIGARDTKYGACGTVLSVCGNPSLNHVPEIVFGVMEEESSAILKEFFAALRNKNIGEI